MAYEFTFRFAPADYLPFRDNDVLERVVNEDLYKKEGNIYENPDFSFKIVHDVHNYFAIDLMQRIRISDLKNEKLVVILPSPENAVFISITVVFIPRNLYPSHLHSTLVAALFF